MSKENEDIFVFLGSLLFVFILIIAPAIGLDIFVSMCLFILLSKFGLIFNNNKENNK